MLWQYCVIVVVALTCSAAAMAQTPSSSPASPTVASVSVADNAAVVADLRRELAQKDARLVVLEAKVGMPTGLTAWAWFLVGLVGEGVFFMRFVVQWWASERQKRTVVPMAFWHLSLIGTGLVLAYAVFVINPVFILAYSLNIFIYVRNLAIARRAPVASLLAEKTSE